MKNKQQNKKIDRVKLTAYLARFAKKGKPARVPPVISDSKSAKETCKDIRQWLIKKT